jgi:hypothetical protein
MRKMQTGSCVGSREEQQKGDSDMAAPFAGQDAYFFFFAAVFLAVVFFALPHGPFALQAIRTLLFREIYVERITCAVHCQ